MKPIYLQENFRYTKHMLFQIMSGHSNPSKEEINVCLKILNKLKERNILASTVSNSQQTSITADYDPQEEYELSKIKDDDKDYKLMFVFVGVIYISGKVLFICPKYLNHTFVLQENTKKDYGDNYDPLLGKDSLYTEEELFQKMKVINKVILKYQKKSNDSRNLDLSETRDNEHTRLMLLLYFLNDYFENGLYTKRKEIRTINGNGETDWNRTVNNSFALISNRKPYYQEIHTRKRVEDEFDYIKELHRCIITECTRELEECDLLNFFDLTGEELTNKTLEDFDDSPTKEVIKNKLMMEMKVQFNSRNLTLLKAMYSYVDESYYRTSSNDELLYSGTKTFCTIWEKICGEILDNRMTSTLDSLPYNKDKFDNIYRPYTSLGSIIPTIHWDFNFQNCKKSSQSLGGLIPDIISTPDANTFIIFDAKYYVPNIMAKSGLAIGVPSVGDVNKQYLYQLAYSKFIKHFEIENVANCFLMPVDSKTIYSKEELNGKVTASLFNDYLGNLVDIQVRFLNADEVYKLYLNEKKYDISNLGLFENDR